MPPHDSCWNAPMMTGLLASTLFVHGNCITFFVCVLNYNCVTTELVHEISLLEALKCLCSVYTNRLTRNTRAASNNHW